MDEQSNTISAFAKLGDFLNGMVPSENTQNEAVEQLQAVIASAGRHNGWFTEASVLYALKQWSQLLTTARLSHWVSPYKFNAASPKTIAIIMAGNIPLVGFHDFLCVLLSGNKALCKLSSNDTQLLPHLANMLIAYEPALKNRIEFTEGKLENYDAVIATGSTNTSRYFEYYFGKKPNIIRKNRTSVALLTGKETHAQLEKLGGDIFRYYGLGCRNVSKLFVPKGYDFDAFFKAMFSNKEVIEHHKYANNYDYNKAVYLMSDFKILDNGFMILKQDEGLHSPISVLYFDYYDDLQSIGQLLHEQQENIQCVVSEIGLENEVSYGSTQNPNLDDYADGVNTLQFLSNL
ncbi:MAG: acyl-CoA reductase [Allomuricauda sp.]|nr:MAG: acyl-CoA reductase [Allomuricauda sp.]